MLHLHPLKQMELWLAMAHKHQTAIIMLTIKWLVCPSLDHLGGIWVITPPSPPGTRAPQLPTVAPHPCTLRCKPPHNLILEHLSHTSSHWVAQDQPS